MLARSVLHSRESGRRASSAFSRRGDPAGAKRLLVDTVPPGTRGMIPRGIVSQIRGTVMAVPATVEDYLATLPEESRAALEKLRKTIKEAAPDATETISYQMPAFKYHGRFLVSYAAFKDHCSFFPASKAVVEALGEELTPYLTGKGTIRFRADKPLSAALVKKIVEKRIEENEAHRRR